MKTIKDLLKQCQPLADSTTVRLQLHLPLNTVRAHAKRLAALGVSKVTLEGGVKRVAKKATAKNKKNAKKAVKKVDSRQRTSVAKKSKAAAKKAAKAVAPAKRAATAPVTQAAVLAALRAKHHTPRAIATAMKANPGHVTRSLSRYTQQGLIVRTMPGHYALT